MIIKAKLNYLRIAPRKVRSAAVLIRGKKVSEAELQLENLLKRSATPILKLVRSAVAGAKHDFGIEKSELTVKEIKVNQGPALKRSLPRAFGRATPIRKQSSHIELVLEAKK